MVRIWFRKLNFGEISKLILFLSFMRFFSWVLSFQLSCVSSLLLLWFLLLIRNTYSKYSIVSLQWSRVFAGAQDIAIEGNCSSHSSGICYIRLPDPWELWFFRPNFLSFRQYISAFSFLILWYPLHRCFLQDKVLGKFFPKVSSWETLHS
jgi:hypothetical protein